MNLTIQGVSRTVENLGKVQAGIASEKPTKKAEEILLRDTRKNTPVDTGALRNSITARVAVRGQTVTGVVGSNLRYAMAVEKGTRPHFPPSQALEGWARRRGVVAFVIARAISRRGTKGHFMFQKALDDNRSRIIREFQDYYNRLTREAS